MSTPDYGRHYWILESQFEDGRWSTPRVAPFSGRYSDADAFVSPDGTKLFYLSKRPVAGAKPKPDFDLWMVERPGDGWSDPIHLSDIVNSDRHELFPTVTTNGTLYFTASLDDSRGAGDVYRSRIIDGRYGPPENLGDAVNSRWHDSTPWIAPDESFLVFASWRPEGPAAGDLYVGYHRNGTWTPARLLPASARGPTMDGRSVCISMRRRSRRHASKTRRKRSRPNTGDERSSRESSGNCSGVMDCGLADSKDRGRRASRR